MRVSGRVLSGAGGWLILAALCGCRESSGARAKEDAGAHFVRLDDTESAPVAVEPPVPIESTPVTLPPTAPAPSAAPAASSGSRAEPAADGAAQSPEVEATLEAQARTALESGSFAAAARHYSALMLGGVRQEPSQSPERLRAWSVALERAQAGHRWSRRGAWPSVEVTVQPGDSLIAIRTRTLAAHPGLLLSTGLIAKANELANETAIRPGDVLRIPTDRASALVDISATWTLYLLGDEVAACWEVGVGQDSSPTRPGDYTIGLKQKEPMWSPVGREPVPYGDPQNPLGSRWLAWFDQGKNSSLGFHGTNDESGIGRRVSDGCVRMRNRDVEILFEILPRDAITRVQP